MYKEVNVSEVALQGGGQQQQNAPVSNAGQEDIPF